MSAEKLPPCDSPRKEEIIQLETTVDHLTGEEIGLALDFLNEMPEVLDAIWIPAIGKKNRPCGILQTLCKPENEALVLQTVFRHTHSLGARRLSLERYILPRQTEKVEIGGKTAPAKIYQLEGISYARPECDFIREEARNSSLGAPAFRIMKKGNAE